jgi:hypothetical protein
VRARARVDTYREETFFYIPVEEEKKFFFFFLKIFQKTPFLKKIPEKENPPHCAQPLPFFILTIFKICSNSF